MSISTQEYDAVIESARKGAVLPAIEQLEKWLKTDVKDNRIIYDLVTLLSRAERHSEVMTYKSRILVSTAPTYALKSFANSARAVGNWDDAKTAVNIVLDKTPDDEDAHAIVAYIWMGQNDLPRAFNEIITRLPKKSSLYKREHLPLLVALADLYERNREFLLASMAYQNVLEIDPGFRYAIRGQVLSLEQAGVPYLANQLASTAPEHFSEDELGRFAHAAVAELGTLGRLEANMGDNPSRFSGLDLALNTSGKILSGPSPSLATRYDRLVALSDRGQTSEAIALYESLTSEKINVPAYAKAAVADAYLAEQRPEIARDLYVEAITEAKKNGIWPDSEWQFSLLYAYSDAEQFDEAQHEAEKLIKESPLYVGRGLPGIERPNPDYTRAAVMAALIRSYSDRLQEAEDRLKDILDKAPDNRDARAAMASVQLSRGHPRTALEEFRMLRVDEPKSMWAALGEGDVLLSLNEYGEAKSILPPLLDSYPESRAVKNFVRKIELYASPRLLIDTNFGRGAQAVGAESVFDAALYSAPLPSPISDRIRAFAHLSRSQGSLKSANSDSTNDDSIQRTRSGLGIDYRSKNISAEAEINRATQIAQKTGVVGSFAWMPTDSLFARAVLDTNTNDLAAAAYRAGTTASRFKMETSWSPNETRKIGGDVARTKFSDGNTRYSQQIWWTERLMSAPKFKLETTLGLYGSQNDATDRPYFNPERDRQASVSATAEWLTFRRYSRSFKQRLIMTTGMYWQKGFDRGSTGDARYEQEWNLNDSLALRFGVGHSFHPYDGEREGRTYGYATLNWVIK